MAGLPRIPIGVHGPLLPGSGGRLALGGGVDLSVTLLEQKVLTQHDEIQRLLAENQRLATMHVAMRQELLLAQQDLQHAKQAFSALQIDKEQTTRALSEKAMKLEADARAMEPLKAELENAKAGSHKLNAIRQDLSNQLGHLTQELQRTRNEAQEVPSLKSEVEALRDEIKRARSAFEYEKKANAELLDQRAVMEKNLVSMAREVEKLRAELTNRDVKTRGNYNGNSFGAPDSKFPSMPSYEDGYGCPQMRVGNEQAWGGGDMQRGSGTILRR